MKNYKFVQDIPTDYVSQNSLSGLRTNVNTHKSMNAITEDGNLWALGHFPERVKDLKDLVKTDPMPWKVELK